GVEVLVELPGPVEGLDAACGEQVGVFSAAGADLLVECPGRHQRSGGGVARAGGIFREVALGVDQARGLAPVVLPAQAVEVPQTGLPALGGVLVVVFDDVVVLGGEDGGAGAARHRADGVAQPQLEPHLGGGVVGLGRDGQVRAGQWIGEDPLPGRLPGGQGPGQLRRQGRHPLERRGGVNGVEQGGGGGGGRGGGGA